MEKYAVNTSILVSKRMLDGGMAQASFSTRSGSHLLPAANDFFIVSCIYCLMWRLVLTLFISQGA
jgi:hypothetical protein